MIIHLGNTLGGLVAAPSTDPSAVATGCTGGSILAASVGGASIDCLSVGWFLEIEATAGELQSEFLILAVELLVHFVVVVDQHHRVQYLSH